MPVPPERFPKPEKLTPSAFPELAPVMLKTVEVFGPTTRFVEAATEVPTALTCEKFETVTLPVPSTSVSTVGLTFRVSADDAPERLAVSIPAVE